MKVIGAGLPRTATLSQKIALETLGFKPCYHMVNVLSDVDQTVRWRAAVEEDASLVTDIFAGFEATVDWPGSFFWRQLLEMYPDAKVLLSVRDGDAWARSMRETIWGVIYGDIFIRHLSDARMVIDPGWRNYMTLMAKMWQRSGLMEDANTTEAEMSASMVRHNEEIKRVVPEDRLLVWTPADGWEPLCEFLEVPVPDAPFPRVNDSAQFADMIADAALAAIQAHRASQEPVGAAH
ncbi:MAG: sulfotransferase family protein [Solirubrobacteraceae bacterium]